MSPGQLLQQPASTCPVASQSGPATPSIRAQRRLGPAVVRSVPVQGDEPRFTTTVVSALCAYGAVG